MVNEWINDNYNNIKDWLSNIIKEENKSIQEDLLHDVIVSFMEHPRAEEIIENGDARWFLVRMTLNQSRSSTSKHYKVYKKYNYEFVDNISDQEEEEYNLVRDMQIETLLNCLDDLYKGTNRERYYAMLILLYMTIGNFSEISRRINIPRTTISTNYKEGIELLKQRYEKQTNKKIELDNKSIKILNSKILMDYKEKNYHEYKDITLRVKPTSTPKPKTELEELEEWARNNRPFFFNYGRKERKDLQKVYRLYNLLYNTDRRLGKNCGGCHLTIIKQLAKKYHG